MRAHHDRLAANLGGTADDGFARVTFELFDFDARRLADKVPPRCVEDCLGLLRCQFAQVFLPA